MKTCDSCSEMGSEIGSGSKKKRKKSSGSSRKRSKQDALVTDYGERVKEARESEQLSIQEVANDLDEKESLISKIEKQDLKPDKPLANKLEKKFDLTLYTNPEVADYGNTGGTDNRKATMKDVADVKEK